MSFYYILHNGDFNKKLLLTELLVESMNVSKMFVMRYGVDIKKVFPTFILVVAYYMYMYIEAL